MSETFDIEILRHALVKAVERYDAGTYVGSLEVYAPELLEAFTRLEQAEQAVARVREVLSHHPRTCDQHTDDDPVKCGRKCAVIDVQNTLDGDNRG